MADRQDFKKTLKQLDKFPKTKIPAGGGVPIEHRIFIGEDIKDPELAKFYWSYDLEIQISKLEVNQIAFLQATYEQIYYYKRLYDRLTDPQARERIMDIVNRLNMEVKILVRGFRGHKGFTVKESGTGRQYFKGDYGIEEKDRKEAEGRIGRLMNKKWSM